MLENTSRKETERALAISLQQGQPQVLALLYDAYAPVLLGLITRIVRNPPKAELILQETFLAIWQKRNTYHAAQSGLLTWMIMVAKETALANLESDKWNDNASEKETDSTLPADDAPVVKSFQELEANEKAALDLVYLKGQCCADAAATLGISEETLKNNLRMAIKHLRANKP
ncbi:hypothetical protein AHMF7605_05910 [Adhaeribacter arboris]|uniref:RNA polymerase sigma-70 region 2 domain-containing protein n=1 Tax=Adhaeribacter arboris TaxID=2072846 RepID=A0A2T2YC73_9BACT|nr:sigma-70 family RNA polymerase sigma factor [Adhaeribacter arboris]PSR53093.1 hypothetical protein AHMF7605_05910 [Adhaeribacter arboris]